MNIGQWWPEEHVVKLKDLVEKGFTARRISEELGRTKNSVISACRRKGLKLISRRGSSSTVKQTPKRSKKERATYTPSIDLSASSPKSIEESMVKPVHGTLLKAMQCKCIIGEPKDLLYCGKPTFNGVWCLEHYKIYLQDPKGT